MRQLTAKKSGSVHEAAPFSLQFPLAMWSDHGETEKEAEIRMLAVGFERLLIFLSLILPSATELRILSKPNGVRSLCGLQLFSFRTQP